MTDCPELTGRLLLEWRNADAPDFMLGDRLVSMRRLRERVAQIQTEESYEATWYSLLMGEHDRHAHNEEYVARLLVLLDRRPVAINALQRSIGVQLGHLFRTLGERAGVEFRAHTSTLRARIREDYYSWPAQTFVDAEGGRILHGGEILEIPRLLEIFKKDARRPLRRGDEEAELGLDADDAFEVDDELMGLLPDVDVVPLPLYPTMRAVPKPPLYRATPAPWRK